MSTASCDVLVHKLESSKVHVLQKQHCQRNLAKSVFVEKAHQSIGPNHPDPVSAVASHSVHQPILGSNHQLWLSPVPVDKLGHSEEDH